MKEEHEFFLFFFFINRILRNQLRKINFPLISILSLIASTVYIGLTKEEKRINDFMISHKTVCNC